MHERRMSSFSSRGGLNSEGACASFPGRHIRRLGDSVRIRSSTPYIPGTFDLFHESNGRRAATPGAKALRAARVDDAALDPVEHRLYPAGAGQHQHLAPTRNYIACSVTELARDLATPIQHSMANIKHLIRYLKTTEHDELELCPSIKLESRQSTFDVVTWADSEWAG